MQKVELYADKAVSNTNKGKQKETNNHNKKGETTMKTRNEIIRNLKSRYDEALWDALQELGDEEVYKTTIGNMTFWDEGDAIGIEDNPANMYVEVDIDLCELTFHWDGITHIATINETWGDTFNRQTLNSVEALQNNIRIPELLGLYFYNLQEQITQEDIDGEIEKQEIRAGLAALYSHPDTTEWREEIQMAQIMLELTQTTMTV